MHPTSPLRILRVDSSARADASTTRQLADELVARLREQHRLVDVTVRDLARTPPPQLDADWVAANFTASEARTPAQHAALALSDEFIAELQAADVVVIGVPVYNFGIPAALKAWIDLVARARVTFRYSEHGPEGLLKGKCAYLVFASGGVALGSATDFASGYMRHVLGFLGIEEIEIIAADRTALRQDAVHQAQQQIALLLPAAAA